MSEPDEIWICPKCKVGSHFRDWRLPMPPDPDRSICPECKEAVLDDEVKTME